MPRPLSEPIRVLHVVARMNRGGAETLIMNVFRAIDRTAVTFDFAVCTEEEGHYDREIASLGGRIFVLPNPRARLGVPYALSLRRVLRQHGPFAAVHSHVHHFSGVVLDAARREGVPVRIAHSHTASDGRFSSPFRWAYGLHMRRLIATNATHLVGCSRAACQALFGPRCWNDSRVAVMRNGVRLEDFENTCGDKAQLRAELDLPSHATLLGHVGRFDRVKNHRFLIRLFRRVLVAIPDAYLVLIGDGPLRHRMRILVHRMRLSERVLFLGVRSDVARVLGAMDAFVFPSIREGFPIAMIEAQIAGLPCVVSSRVPQEADLGLGLVRFVDLERGVGEWVQSMLEALQVQCPDWHTRRRAAVSAGLDVRSVCETLRRVYAGGTP